MTTHQVAMFFAQLWAERSWTHFEDDLMHFLTLDMPCDSDHFMEAMFGLCKAKALAC